MYNDENNYQQIVNKVKEANKLFAIFIDFLEILFLEFLDFL